MPPCAKEVAQILFEGLFLAEEAAKTPDWGPITADFWGRNGPLIGKNADYHRFSSIFQYLTPLKHAIKGV